MDPTVGVTLGKYQLVATIGRGGMADVFLALARGDMGFTKLVVLKCMRVTDQEQAFTSMFFDEVRLAARLSHPNIVTTFDGGDADGTYFLAMEFLEGQSLDQVWRAWSGPYQPDHRVWALVMAEVLSGLGYAHALKDFDGSPLHVVHRDVSPQNIFLTYDGAVKLMDFGIAKAASNVNHTEAGTLKGKIRYMSPEQFGGRPVDHRSDLFSAGVVLWELIAGQRLLHGEVGTVMQRLLSPEPLTRLSEVLPDIPPRLDALVAKALEKDPARRFPRASEMRAELLTFVREAGGLDPSELGRALLQTFSEHREEVRAQVEAHVLRAGNAHTVRELGSVRLGAGLDTPSSGSMRPPPRAAPVGIEATQMAAGKAAAPLPGHSPSMLFAPTGISGSARLPTPATPEPAPAPRRRVLPLALGAAALVVAVVGVAVLRPASAPEPAPALPVEAPVVRAPPPAPPEARAPEAAPPAVEAKAPEAPAATPEARAPGDLKPAPAEAAAREPGARTAAPERAVPPPAARAVATRPGSAGAVLTGGPAHLTGAPASPPVVVASAGPPPAPAPAEPRAAPAPEVRAAPPATEPPARAAPPPPTPAAAPTPGLSKGALKAVLDANREKIQDCYEHATLDGRPIRGKVKLTIDLAGDGAVNQVNETSTILERGAQLERCILESVRQWKFPPTGDGAPTQVVHTLTFGNGP